MPLRTPKRGLPIRRATPVSLLLLGRASLVVSLLGFVAACSSTLAPPEFTLAFQSTHMAVVTDVVQVSAYAVKEGDVEFGAGAICGTILSRLRKSQDVGVSPLIRSSVATPCEIEAGKKGSLEVPYGIRALVAIGYDPNGIEMVIGCSVAVVEPGAAPITISMTLFDPATPLSGQSTCTKLADRCSGAC